MSETKQLSLDSKIKNLLHFKVYAHPKTIATALQEPLHRVIQILRSEDYYHDDKDMYALVGKARQELYEAI